MRIIKGMLFVRDRVLSEEEIMRLYKIMPKMRIIKGMLFVGDRVLSEEEITQLYKIMQ